MDFIDFQQFWDLIRPDTGFQNRRAAAEHAWKQCTRDKQQAIIDWLRQHGPYPQRNPYFFIQDFRVMPKEPTNWNNRALKDGVKYVSAQYNGQWGMYTEEDVRKFGLKVAER